MVIFLQMFEKFLLGHSEKNFHSLPLRRNAAVTERTIQKNGGMTGGFGYSFLKITVFTYFLILPLLRHLSKQSKTPRQEPRNIQMDSFRILMGILPTR